MIFFTSDLHMSHNNILNYCSRPNATIIDMNAQIINNWNSVVGKGDIVYVLGDVGFFRTREEVEDLLKKLNGQKFLVIGNHDDDRVTKAKGWVKVSPLLDIRINYKDKQKIPRTQLITLCHYAMKVWKHSGHGSWQLYGHSHGTLQDDPNSFQLDVGVDAHNYTPISFFEVKKLMEKKYFLPKDYHGHAGVSTIPEHAPVIKRTYDKITICGQTFNDPYDWEKNWDEIFSERGEKNANVHVPTYLR